MNRMDAAPTGRSFTCLALSLLILGFATSQVDPMARARDPVAAIPRTGVMSRAARPLCDAARLDCQATSWSRNSGHLTAPGGVPEPPLPRVRTSGSDLAPHLQSQLQLQRDLFT